MNTCYVSMPFGKKVNNTGETIDFDYVYFTVIRPSVEKAGMQCIRKDDSSIVSINKQIYDVIIGSDVMIADLTTLNPNVLYELGIRHALKKGITILICAKGSDIPFDLDYSRIFFYDLKSAYQIGEEIEQIIYNSIKYVRLDSPIHELYSNLNIELPDELVSSEIKRRYPKKEKKYSASIKNNLSKIEITLSESQNNPEDALAQIELLKMYHSSGKFTDLIEKYQELPPYIQSNPEAKQLFAMALYRRQNQGDDEYAINVLKSILNEIGEDVETYSLLGSIYKRRYNDKLNIDDLNQAISYYRMGYSRQPANYYLGANLAFLLFQRDSDLTINELNELLPQIWIGLQNKMLESPQDYWAYSTALELSCISRDWASAFHYLENAINSGPSNWMLIPVIVQLEKIEAVLKSEIDKQQARQIMFTLKTVAGLGEGHRNA